MRWLFLILVLPVHAQSVDSLWVLKDAREWTEAHQTELLIPLTGLTVAAQGFLHGQFYERGEDRLPGDIHLASEILGAMHFSTAYAAGLDPIQAFGATLIGNFFFQCSVNIGSGLPCIDPQESKPYHAAGLDLSFKRIFLGYWRLADIVIGVVLIAYKPIVRWIW